MHKLERLLIGCVADDFTGASDAASFLEKNKMRTLLLNGTPGKDFCVPDSVSAIVIALKTRNCDVHTAVYTSMEAFEWLKRQGAEKLYFKYCSTFDSTPQGNIGPVIDAVLERYSIPYTVICPALIENKRTVKGGILYVDGVPLANSHMKDHPLNPMWESDIELLMRPQGKYPCYKVNAEMLKKGRDFIDKRLDTLAGENEHFYICVDYFESRHGAMITEIFGELEFFTGGSGLAGDIAARMRPHGDESVCVPQKVKTDKGRIILCASCSKATQRQVKAYIGTNKPSMEITPQALLSGEMSLKNIRGFLKKNEKEDILLYSSGSAGAPVLQEEGSAELENFMAQTAKYCVENGWRKIVVGGGETSGAVTQALGFDSFIIGPSIAPGVPEMTPSTDENIRIVLKSGNFGEDDFFIKALKDA